MRALTSLAATAVLVAALPAQWAQINPTTFPTTRRAGACAWDAPGNRLIFAGGLTQTPGAIIAQTWAYNGTWTLLPAATTGRWGHRLVRNTQNNRLITFGGRSPTVSAFANDTVEWTGSAWSPVTTANAPSPRFLYGLAFDQARNVVVLFGGRSNTSTLGDTWEYNGTNWVQRTFTLAPPARQDAVMAYDPGLGRTVLYGGFDDNTDTVLGDTWQYDGTEWLLQSPLSSPSPRYAAEAIFDSTRQRIVLYGGFTGTALAQDTYEYTGDTWNLVATATPPHASTDALHGYDPVRKKFVLFGGYGGTFLSETWEYSGANSAFTSHFGEGTPTAEGVPTISSNPPVINQPWTVTVANLPSTQEFVLVAIGGSNTTWNGLPLPIDLGVIGLPGALLWVAAQITNVVTTAPSPGLSTNEATSTTAIPNNISLVNASLFAEGLLFNISSGLQFNATTQGLRAVIGQ